jgi:hypothetical protein
MSNKVIQRTKPVQVGVNATVGFDGNGTDGFIPVTSGTITITTRGGLAIITSLPVTAGQPVPLPFSFPDNSQGGTIVAAGGASGVLCV